MSKSGYKILAKRPPLLRCFAFHKDRHIQGRKGGRERGEEEGENVCSTTKVSSLLQFLSGKGRVGLVHAGKNL